MKIIFPTGATATLRDIGPRPSLRTLQSVVGGYIEIVSHVNPRRCLIVNEDAIRLGLERNPTATTLVRPGTLMAGGLRGTVIECSAKDSAAL